MTVQQSEVIISRLKQFGFTEYEAKVYLSLISKNPATAYTISQDSGVPHSRVYDIARRLIKKGAAVLISKNPDTFSAVAPQDLIQKIRKDHSRYLGDLEEKLKGLDFKADFDPVWNISDRSQALQIARDFISQAKEKIFLGIWDPELEELLNEVKAARKRGVRFFFLIYGEMKMEFGEVFYHRTENIFGVSDMGHTIDCVVDSRYCLSGSLGGSVPAQVIWTKNRGLVKSIEEYIIHDFYIAEIQKLFGKELQEKLGRNLADLRKKYR